MTQIRLHSLFSLLMLSILALCEIAAADTASTLPSGSAKQTSLESLEELALRGKYFEAMVHYTEAPDRLGIADQLAVAKSAWALGLVDTARKLWDQVLADKNFEDAERSRASLARAILELQEGKPETARAIAESAAQKLTGPSELRAQYWLLIAEALKAQGALSLAEGYYKKAVAEGDAKTSSEATYYLGESQYQLGLINESRYSYAALDIASPYTAKALRRLAEIDLAQRNYEGVLNWIEEARESYPGEFSDGWTSYARISALVELGRLDTAEAELNSYRVRHNDLDSWYALAQAGIESAYAKPLDKDNSAKPNKAEEKKGAKHAD